MKRLVLISCPYLQETIDRYRESFLTAGLEAHLPEVNQHLSESELLEVIEPFHGMIAGDDEFTRRVFERAVNLRVISKWGIGIDSIDAEAAEDHGVRVFNTPNAFGDEVADVAMAYVVLLFRGLHLLDRGVREGGWPKIRGTSIGGKTLGIIGYGSIGAALAKRARVAGMQVVTSDIKRLTQECLASDAVRQVELGELLRESDVVALTCSLTRSNRRMIGSSELNQMKAGAYLVNTARGGLVDEKALIAALRSERLAGAALDVFEVEPLPIDSELRRIEGCILGTHNASNTTQAVLRVNETAIANLLKGLED